MTNVYSAEALFICVVVFILLTGGYLLGLFIDYIVKSKVEQFEEDYGIGIDETEKK